jgi:hypothetical protein
MKTRIWHGGVQATAFETRDQQLYDAVAWLRTGAMVPAGRVRELKITTESKS